MNLISPQINLAPLNFKHVYFESCDGFFVHGFEED